MERKLYKQLFVHFLLGFFIYSIKYIIKNWVSNSDCSMQLGQSSRHWSLSSSVSLSLAGRPRCGHRNLMLLQPSAIPQFLPPCSRVSGLLHQSRLTIKLCIFIRTFEILLFLDQVQISNTVLTLCYTVYTVNTVHIK